MTNSAHWCEWLRTEDVYAISKMTGEIKTCHLTSMWPIHIHALPLLTHPLPSLGQTHIISSIIHSGLSCIHVSKCLARQNIERGLYVAETCILHSNSPF